MSGRLTRQELPSQHEFSVSRNITRLVHFKNRIEDKGRSNSDSVYLTNIHGKHYIMFYPSPTHTLKIILFTADRNTIPILSIPNTHTHTSQSFSLQQIETLYLFYPSQTHTLKIILFTADRNTIPILSIPNTHTHTSQSFSLQQIETLYLLLSISNTHTHNHSLYSR